MSARRAAKSLYCRLLALVLAALTLCAAPLAAQPDLADLPYGPDPKQQLDVYLPQTTANAPVIVLVHGGGWRFGDKANDPVWRNKAAHWTTLGAIVVSVNYRLLPEANPMEQAQDVARALAYVQDHAVEWGGSAQRVALVGHSAGAHLVALISADPGLAQAMGARGWLASVALDTAMLDPLTIMSTAPSPLYMQAFGDDPAFWTQVSPLARLQPSAPPMLLVCSTQRVNPCPQARTFATSLTALGGVARVLPIDLSHRAINEAIGLHPAYTAELDAFLRDTGLWGPS